MKTIIDAIEQALASHSEWSWKQLGFNPTFGQAYLYSRDAGNDLLNFADTIWDNEIPAILEDCHRTGITEFTISSTFSSMVKTIAEFERHGCRLQGMTEINSNMESWDTGEKERIPAFMMTVC